MTEPKPPAKRPAKPQVAANSPVPRIPAKKPAQRQSTLTPTRLGTIIQSVLAGDTIRAACGSAAVAVPTYNTWMQRGQAAINQARALTDEDDMEGAVWQFILDHGGHQNGSPNASYWSEKPPQWWPRELADRWVHVLLVVLVYWARGQAERVYRQVVTTAATGGDWKAAEFMLTHSFGWSKTERIEHTGANGGPIEVQGDEESTLAALALLAERRKAIEG